ncbi:MAG: hypothetical protein AB7F96_09990 [Beijerinckiaceae bacterium]
MLDKHTAKALMHMGRISPAEYLRLFGEDERTQGNEVRKQANAARARRRQPPRTAMASPLPTLPGR